MQKFLFIYYYYYFFLGGGDSGANKVNLGDVQMGNTKLLFYISDNNKRYLPCHYLL